jgi:hypothetical protein
VSPLAGTTTEEQTQEINVRNNTQKAEGKYDIRNERTSNRKLRRKTTTKRKGRQQADENVNIYKIIPRVANPAETPRTARPGGKPGRAEPRRKRT